MEPPTIRKTKEPKLRSLDWDEVQELLVPKEEAITKQLESMLYKQARKYRALAFFRDEDVWDKWNDMSADKEAIEALIAENISLDNIDTKTDELVSDYRDNILEFAVTFMDRAIDDAKYLVDYDELGKIGEKLNDIAISIDKDVKTLDSIEEVKKYYQKYVKDVLYDTIYNYIYDGYEDYMTKSEKEEAKEIVEKFIQEHRDELNLTRENEKEEATFYDEKEMIMRWEGHQRSMRITMKHAAKEAKAAKRAKKDAAAVKKARATIIDEYQSRIDRVKAAYDAELEKLNDQKEKALELAEKAVLEEIARRREARKTAAKK